MLGVLLSTAASLISGLAGRSGAKKRAEEEKEAIREANRQATENANKMNYEVRARADAAALVPVQTQSEHIEDSTVDTTGGVDMDAFMQAAEDYGFNPLTFLRSGALGYFATTHTEGHTYIQDFTCTTGERAMDAALAGQHIPDLQAVVSQTQVPTMGEVFSNALTTGVNQYLNEASQAANNQFQMDKMNAYLKGSQQPGSFGGNRSFYTPNAQLTGSVSTGGRNDPDNLFTTADGTKLPLLWADYYDQSSGKIVRLPNPDIADSEQIAAALGGIAVKEAQDAGIIVPKEDSPYYRPKEPLRVIHPPRSTIHDGWITGW